MDKAITGEEIQPRVSVSLHGEVNGPGETMLGLTDSYEVGLELQHFDIGNVAEQCRADLAENVSTTCKICRGGELQ